MEKPKILSGYDLVARGTTKLDGALPEIGVKDVQPNGSWLEQKQIQSALESRKQLIEVERIEKSGSISHAEWREELMLAEVTQKVGGYWQYIGHNVGKQLFLKPEEALFLIEVNCLLLKYNGVTVSLQQAYSLLLRGKITLFHYKVYASLSRLGYKVFRHDEHKEAKSSAEKYSCEDIQSDTVVKDLKEEVDVSEIETSGHQDPQENESDKADSNSKDILSQSNNVNAMVVNRDSLDAKENSDNVKSELVIVDKVENNSSNKGTLEQLNDPTNVSWVCNRNTDVIMSECEKDNVHLKDSFKERNTETSRSGIMNINTLENLLFASQKGNDKLMVDQLNMPRSKLKELESRTVKPCNFSTLQKCFENFPELYQKHVFTVSVPSEDHIPKNIFLNKTCYVLSVDKIQAKNSRRSSSTEPQTYSMGEEVSGIHVRRVRDSATQSPPRRNCQQTFTPNRFPRFQTPNFRPVNFWRPLMGFPFQYSLFQRPFLPNILFFPRLHMFRQQYPFTNMPGLTSFNSNINYGRNQQRRSSKRKRSDRNSNKHFEAIKSLALRLRELARLDPSNQEHNVESLQRLIRTYNERYRTNLCLTEDYEIIDKNVVETIELDCDDEPKKKMQKSDSQSHNYTENFIKLKQLAIKLKELESKGKATSRHRRAFSNVIKKFNKSYKADVIMNGKFELHDRSLISLDSSSDSDCVIEETPVTSSGKILRNPFNILKRLSKKRDNSPVASTSNGEKTEKLSTPRNKYSETLLKTFDKNWLPEEDDFGRAEVVSGNITLHYLIDSRKDEFIYEYIKGQNYNFNNWLEAKLSFFTSIAESMNNHKTEAFLENDSDLKPIIGPDDYTDFPSVLKKLSIISANKDINSETELSIDFDVYNRDVKNFKKSNRPKPHFRVICIEESSNIPSGLEIATLHSKYTDNVVILFAVVGIGSVSYLQMNPTELPVYVPGYHFD